jgi:hypothetical protein
MGCTGIRVSAIPIEERAGIALQIFREDFDRVGGERDLAQRTDGLEISGEGGAKTTCAVLISESIKPSVPFSAFRSLTADSDSGGQLEYALLTSLRVSASSSFVY